MRRPLPPRVLAILLALAVAVMEGASMASGFAERPSLVQAIFFAIAVLLAGHLGWIAAPKVPNPLKKAG